MLKKRDGFTLIELMVVALIIGILGAIAIPQYVKTVETSRARSACGITHLISVANRMYKINNGVYKSGVMHNNHPLVKENYMAPQNWGTKYTFSALITGGAECTRTDGSYAGWGYTFDKLGVCSPKGTSPKCPTF